MNDELTHFQKLLSEYAQPAYFPQITESAQQSRLDRNIAYAKLTNPTQACANWISDILTYNRKNN